MPPRPLPVIGGVVRAAVRGTSPQSQQWVNVHHLMYADGASSPGSVEIAAADALLTRLYTGTVFAGGTPWLTNVYNGWSLSQIDYTVLDGTSLGYTFAHLVAGASAAASLPPECAPVLTLLTGRRGRRYRGRIFMPAPTQGSVATNGTLAPSVPSGIRTQYLGMLAALAAIQWKPTVASYGLGSYKGSPTSWTPFATPITDVRMDVNVDVQRRRKM
jgi:hypothetical protein